MLLSLVTNLTCLRLYLPPKAKELSRVLQHAVSSWGEDRRLLPRLTTLEICYEMRCGGFNLLDIAPLLFLPSLTTLITTSCRDSSGFRLEPGSLGIQKISLKTSALMDKDLVDLIRGCRSLRDLLVEYADESMGPVYEIDFRRIA